MGPDARILATRPTESGIELVVAEGAARGDAPAAGLDGVRDEIRRLREEVAHRERAVAPGLEDLDRRLRAGGLDAELRARALAAAAPHAGLDALAAASTAIAAAVPVLPPSGPRAEGARVVALVGPTGVG